MSTPTDEELQAEEEREWTWRDLCPYIGYTVLLSGPIPAAYRQRKLDLAKTRLERVAKEYYPEARVVIQEGRDFIGFDQWWAHVWIHPGLSDFRLIWGMREHLEENGHHVSSISVNYDPPMA